MPPFGFGERLRPQSSSPPFSPADLSNLIHWFRSDSGVTQSGSVSQWDDKVAPVSMQPPASAPTYNGTDLQYNNLPSLHTIDNTSGMVTTSNVTYGVYTYFLIMKPISGGYLATHNDGLEYFFGTVGDTSYTGNRGGTGSTAYNIPFTDWSTTYTPKIYTKRFDGTYAGDIVRLNGVEQFKSVVGGDDAGTDPLVQPFSIAGNLTPAFGAQGSFAEIIIYDRVLSDSECEQVEQYAYDRYAFFNNKSFWLRADTNVTSDPTTHAVSAWGDMSTAGIMSGMANADGASQPLLNASGINGNPDLSFDGTQFLFGDSTLLGQAGVTLFGIFKTTSITTNFIFGQQYNSYQYAVFMDSGGGPGLLNFYVHEGFNCFSTDAFNDGNPHWFIATYDAQGTGILNLYVDSVASPQGTATTGIHERIINDNGDVNSLGTSHGSGPTDHDRPFVGNIAEVGSYDWQLNPTQLGQLAAYLNGRAGI